MDLEKAEEVVSDIKGVAGTAGSIASGASSFFGGLLSKIIVGLVVLAVACGLAFMWGRSSIKADYEKKLADRDAYLLKLQQQNDQKQEKIVVQYVDKIRTIDHEVRVYVPSPDACTVLDGRFRVFFDSAATGIQLPPGASYPDAAPVAVSDVAATIDLAAKRYRQLQQQVIDLQSERQAISSK